MNKIKCPKCGKTVSIIWFLFYSKSSFKCKGCNSTLHFNDTKRKASRISIMIATSLAVLCYLYTDIIIISRMLTVLLLYVLVNISVTVILTILMPEQFSQIDD